MALQLSCLGSSCIKKVARCPPAILVRRAVEPLAQYTSGSVIPRDGSAPGICKRCICEMPSDVGRLTGNTRIILLRRTDRGTYHFSVSNYMIADTQHTE